MRGRNANERAELWRRLMEIHAERESALASVPVDNDEVYDAVWDKFSSMETAVYNKWFFLDYPEPKNAWFRGFAESFGECKDKRISEKQAGVFMKYMEESHNPEYGRGTSYYCRIGNVGYKLTMFPSHKPGYLTTTKF